LIYLIFFILVDTSSNTFGVVSSCLIVITSLKLAIQIKRFISFRLYIASARGVLQLSWLWSIITHPCLLVISLALRLIELCNQFTDSSKSRYNLHVSPFDVMLNSLYSLIYW